MPILKDFGVTTHFVANEHYETSTQTNTQTDVTDYMSFSTLRLARLRCESNMELSYKRLLENAIVQSI